MMQEAETQTLTSRVLKFVQDKYEELLERISKSITSLNTLEKATRALQIMSSLLSIAMTILPLLDTVIPGVKFVTISMGAISSFVGGLLVMLIDLEKRKKSEMRSDTRTLVKVMKVLDSGYMTDEDLDKIVELNVGDNKK